MKVPFVFSPLKLVSIAVSLRTAYSLGPTDTATCIAHPDPHFTTFDGIHYDYQHGCDVVLIDSIALKIQLRLKKYQPISPTFSEIDRLAINFQNGDTLEIDRNGNHFVNMNMGTPNPLITSIGGFTFIKTNGAIPWVDKEYEIQLSPPGHSIKIMDLSAAAKGGGLGIVIEGHGTMFNDATGMCGKWNALTPGLYDRDGVLLPLPPALVINGALFGDLWQVAPGAPYNDIAHISATNLPYPLTLHSAYPATCVARRRLPEQERKIQSLPCDHCLTLNNLVQRANCEYDASVIGCGWTKNVPFYSKDDTLWYNKDDNCCLHRVEADEGYKYVKASSDSPNSFGTETCQHDNDKNCFQKTKCFSGEDCWTLQKCFNDDAEQCYMEYKCFGACVQRTKVKQGYEMEPTKGPGYKYDQCDHNSNCFERKTCSGQTDKSCKLYKACDASITPVKKLCFRDVKCSDPCSPTPSPTPIQTTSSPTCTGDAKCFRLQKAVNGFTLVKATSLNKFAFSMDYTCKSQECYQKKKCNFNSEDACFVLRECKGDGCFEEVLCGCVRQKEVNIGFRYQVTGRPGFFYKTCAHDENCKERVPCEGDNCGQLVDCKSKNLGCFEEIPCSSDCVPTSSPTKKTKSPTKVPTRSSTEEPTAGQGDPWKCDGCKSMHKYGQVVTDGTADFCKIVLKPKSVKSVDGECDGISSENQCKSSSCLFQYKLRYSIKQACREKKWCKIIIADAYTAGTSPPTPIVKPAKKKGFITTEKFFKVECLCKTHKKVFKLECTNTDNGRVSSKSVELDYTCSECDKKWLAEKR
mmetsp:Transcript_7723/g.16064  ORF Transcript_7723/g.16064 Transcript_7723/m.16064 type:complete len:805 (+) Transcript_7723:72-2486(+)